MADTRNPVRRALWVLGVGLTGFVCWLIWAPLGEGVVAAGSVVNETRHHTIQHFSGGTVTAVRVKEGQAVRAGDILLELDNAPARANLQAVRQNYLAQRATESRLQAELANASTIAFHPDLQGQGDDPDLSRHLATQQHIFSARRLAQRSEQAAIAEQIAALQQQVAGTRAMLAERQTQQAALDTQLRNIRELADQGYAPRNQALQLEQSAAELRSTLEDMRSTLGRTERGIGEARQRSVQRREEYLKEVGTQLADVQREVFSGQDKLRALQQEVSRVEIRAPVDGQVVSLAVTAVGGVATPGQRLLDIVPEQRQLLVDVRIPPQSIDRVAAGGLAEVRLHAFAKTPDLVLPARLLSVSTDAVVDASAAQPVTYYQARLAIEPEGLKRLGSRVLQPGMPAEVIIVTGERSLLTYLLHPFLKRVASAMKEE